MPSQAYREFRYNLMDALRLSQAHTELSKKTPGKKGLSHLTRSGVVMLCAAWERYHEAVIVEAVGYLAKETRDPNNLPLSVRKNLSAVAKNHKHDLKPMELAGEGWRTLYVALATDETDSLNTPKSTKLKNIYESLTGLSDVTTLWTNGAKVVDDFVSTRGNIAHKGRNSPYIYANELENYISMIVTIVTEHDNKFCEYLTSVAKAYQPWNRMNPT